MNPFNSTIVYIVNHDICGEFGNSSRNKRWKANPEKGALFPLLPKI